LEGADPTIPIDALDRREAAALLLRRTPDQDQVSASQMAEKLGACCWC
jgi:hypothetical protein